MVQMRWDLPSFDGRVGDADAEAITALIDCGKALIAPCSPEPEPRHSAPGTELLRCEYVYVCTSKRK